MLLPLFKVRSILTSNLQHWLPVLAFLVLRFSPGAACVTQYNNVTVKLHWQVESASVYVNFVFHCKHKFHLCQGATLKISLCGNSQSTGRYPSMVDMIILTSICSYFKCQFTYCLVMNTLKVYVVLNSTLILSARGITRDFLSIHYGKPCKWIYPFMVTQLYHVTDIASGTMCQLEWHHVAT